MLEHVKFETGRSLDEPGQHPVVVAVILSYNSIETLLPALEAARDQTVSLRNVYVVDNGSTDGSREYLDAAEEDVHLLFSPENVGVGAGHNLGWETALELEKDAEFIWALEHDSIPENDCLEKLIATFRRFQSDGVRPATVLPRQVHPDPSVPNNGRINARSAAYVDTKMTFNAALVSTAAIREVGLLREDFFVGHEDREYAWRLTQAGYSVVHEPTAVVLHRNKGVHRQGSPSVLRDYYSVRNELYLRASIRRERFAATRVAVRSIFHLLRTIVRADHRGARTRGRLAAVRDGAKGDLGPKSYWFLGRGEDP